MRPVGQVPEHDLMKRLGRARRQHPAIGTEGQAQTIEPASKGGLAHVPGLDIPEMDGAAVIAGGKDLAVGPEGQRRDIVDMRQQRRRRPRRRRVPDLARGARAAPIVESAVMAGGRETCGRPG